MRLDHASLLLLDQHKQSCAWPDPSGGVWTLNVSILRCGLEEVGLLSGQLLLALQIYKILRSCLLFHQHNCRNSDFARAQAMW